MRRGARTKRADHGGSGRVSDRQGQQCARLRRASNRCAGLSADSQYNGYLRCDFRVPRFALSKDAKRIEVTTCHRKRRRAGFARPVATHAFGAAPNRFSVASALAWTCCNRALQLDQPGQYELLGRDARHASESTDTGRWARPRLTSYSHPHGLAPSNFQDKKVQRTTPSVWHSPNPARLSHGPLTREQVRRRRLRDSGSLRLSARHCASRIRRSRSRNPSRTGFHIARTRTTGPCSGSNQPASRAQERADFHSCLLRAMHMLQALQSQRPRGQSRRHLLSRTACLVANCSDFEFLMAFAQSW